MVVVEGERRNLKLTLADDLELAQALLDGARMRRTVRNRVGLGFDVHPFGDAPPLVLGGVRIAGRAPPRRPLRRRRGRARGRRRAARARRACPISARCSPPPTRACAAPTRSRCSPTSSTKIADDGWWIDNVDIVIAAETPRLAPYMAEMAAKLTAVLAPAKEPMGRGIHVSVRPKRAEGLGAIGRAEGIAVWAVALLSRGVIEQSDSCAQLGSLARVLRIYDTAARAKVDFVPAHAGRVSMYVCGPTPYDVPHLGHGRKEVVFDTIRRYLLWCGFEVTYVSNVTDVDDNIIARAQRDGTTEPELAPQVRSRVLAPVRPPQHPAARRDAPRDRVDRPDADDRSRSSSARVTRT